MGSIPSPYPPGGSGGITPPAGDLGGTTAAPTVVATHLAAALPVAQGGTGAATAAAALADLGGAAVAGDIGGTSAAPTVTSTHLAAPLPASQGGTGSTLPVFTLAATTGLAGTALIGGTQVIATATTPNDGLMHNVRFVLSLQVTTVEVGGMITTGFTDPQSNAHSFTAIAGAQAVSLQTTTVERLVAPNTVVSVNQGSALTSGASVLNADIWIA